MQRLVHLLGDHAADEVAGLERLHHHIVGPEVELLDDLALDVDAAGGAEPAAQRGMGELAGDELAGDRELAQHDGQVARRGRHRSEML